MTPDVAIHPCICRGNGRWSVAPLAIPPIYFRRLVSVWYGIYFKRGAWTGESSMTLELGVAVVAVVISMVSFVVNLYASRAADRHGRMPILITEYFQERVLVRNIGKGPDVNVVMADALGILATTDARNIHLRRFRDERHWGSPWHLERIPENGQVTYSWKSESFQGALGISYTDVLGSPYTLLNSQFGTKAINLAVIPHKSLNELQYPQRLELTERRQGVTPRTQD